MERRTFLKGAIVAGATPAAWAPPRAEMLSTLLSEYETATRIDRELWGIAADLEDCDAVRAKPRERIQVSKRFVGRDAEGADRFEPIYAYSIKDIEAHERYSLETNMLFVRNGDQRARVEGRYAQRVAEKADRLNAIKAQCQRIEDECGLTVALMHAKAASARVREIEQTILDLVPTSLEEAARKARWIVAELNDDRTYMNDREDIAQVALAAIGKAIG